MTSISADCVVLYDVLYINAEPRSSQDITKRQIMYVRGMYRIFHLLSSATTSIFRHNMSSSFE